MVGYVVEVYAARVCDGQRVFGQFPVVVSEEGASVRIVQPGEFFSDGERVGRYPAERGVGVAYCLYGVFVGFGRCDIVFGEVVREADGECVPEVVLRGHEYKFWHFNPPTFQPI